MIDFHNGGVLIENSSELPSPEYCPEVLYIDFETSSCDPLKKSLNPWKRENCRTIGAALTWDGHPKVYFVPRELLLHDEWLQNLIGQSGSLCNHHIQYDAHVAYNDLSIDFLGRPLVCTLALAKVYDSDRAFLKDRDNNFIGGYTLDKLSKSLCNYDISEYELRLKPYIHTKKTKEVDKNLDYGAIPIVVLADYACQDVVAVRKLREFLDKEIPEECAWVRENEIKLTSVLIEMERRGLRIVPNQVTLQLALTLKRMSEVSDRLHELLYTPEELKRGKVFLPSSYNDVYDLLINSYCFPKIKKEGAKGEASFDKHTLKRYSTMGGDWAGYSETVKLIAEYRSLDTHKGLYWEAWLELRDENGILNSEYNQNMRTGRTSSRQPNAQQLDKWAKSQIVARDDYVLLCYDYNQQEFRWMMHYLNHEEAIRAYHENPKTDYHQWVADTLCEGLVKRKPAKTLNFAIGFGAGKNKVLSMLSTEHDIVEMANGDKSQIRRMSLRVYEGYHRNLPQLKENQRMAANAVRSRGYARTVYGRHLKIPVLFDYKAFNNVVQSTAADSAKEAMTAASPLFNEKLRALDCHLLAVVHDEFVFELPEQSVEEADAEIQRCLRLPGARCKVPVIADRGPVARDWATAKP